MPDPEALHNLLAGSREWDKFRATVPGFVDLTFADLSGKHLDARNLDHCDFSCAQLEGASFDRATLRSCMFDTVNLSNSSFVGTVLDKVEFRNASIDAAIFRKSSWTEVGLTNTSANGTQIAETSLLRTNISALRAERLNFLNSHLTNCQLKGVAVAKLEMHRIRVEDCDISEWDVAEIDMLNCFFGECSVASLKAHAGILVSCRFVECDLISWVILESQCMDLDFHGSTIVHTELGSLGIETAAMLDCALIDCTWPEQKGRVTATGRYVASPQLLKQPVQDLKGVPPVTRREIADAQYLVKMIETSSLTERVGLRLWGLCAGFGQSLGRLTATTMFLILLTTVGLLLARGQVAWSLTQAHVSSTLLEAFNAFFAIANVPEKGNDAELAVVVTARIAGILMLGMWVTIASNKLSRLGAE